MFSKEIESDVIALPPDVDELTDEENFDDDEMTTPSVKARGSYDYYFDEKNEITIVKWKDNKCVTTATNCDYIEPLIQVSRHQKGLKEKSQILQPTTVHQYKKNMGGVNQHDCFLEKHTIQILGKDGTGQSLLVTDMAIVNTYILFNLTNCEKKSIKDIRRYITVAYLKRRTNSKKGIRRPLMMSSRSKRILSNPTSTDNSQLGKKRSEKQARIKK
ncbi:piggyBac transposable element-derived protein 2 [Trichonephila clavipes]|uniref:PiggyBac transposable element-derived protein 2 n=1 Tax=Trichonephila clavipes TaxID=2585209 RepID=A0A8X6RW64_TRICX|nr:piggyBac transposable element-derived protein 2 [Trichonephila clavipes]